MRAKRLAVHLLRSVLSSSVLLAVPCDFVVVVVESAPIFSEHLHLFVRLSKLNHSTDRSIAVYRVLLTSTYIASACAGHQLWSRFPDKTRARLFLMRERMKFRFSVLRFDILLARSLVRNQRVTWLTYELIRISGVLHPLLTRKVSLTTGQAHPAWWWRSASASLVIKSVSSWNF